MAVDTLSMQISPDIWALFTSLPATSIVGTSARNIARNLATRRESTRIKDERIRQSFLKDNIFELGKTEMDFQGDKIKIYNQERMLIELIRNKSKIAFDFYKEIIGNYRKRVNKIDFGKVSEYVEHFKMNQTIMNTIQMEVL